MFFQLEIIDACVNYIETLQTQLNVVSKEEEEDQDLLNNNNDGIDEDFEIENSTNEKSDDKS